MQWATKRKIIIAAILAVLLLLIIVGAAASLLIKPSSCFDSKKNGAEIDVDCGGSCARLCSTQVQRPFVDFVQVVQDGNTASIVARVTNPNKDAEVSNLEYTARSFSSGGLLLEEFRSSVNMEPNQKTALLIPLGLSNAADASRASIELSGGVFVKNNETERDVFVEDFTWTLLETSPSLNIVVENVGEQLLRAPLIVVAFGENEKVLGANMTVIPQINEGDMEVFVSWAEPFSENPRRVEFFFEQ